MAVEDLPVALSLRTRRMFLVTSLNFSSAFVELMRPRCEQTSETCASGPRRELLFSSALHSSSSTKRIGACDLNLSGDICGCTRLGQIPVSVLSQGTFPAVVAARPHTGYCPLELRPTNTALPWQMSWNCATAQATALCNFAARLPIASDFKELLLAQFEVRTRPGHEKIDAFLSCHVLEKHLLNSLH